MSRNSISDGGICPGFFVKKEKNKGMIRVKKQKYCIRVKGMLRKCLTKI